MIHVEGLTKYYGERAAIRDLSFDINSGEVVGFLGQNGAGKSTTLKILSCVLLPTAGQVSIEGFDIGRDPHEIRKRIGFLPDTPPLYDEMTVERYLAFVAELRGVRPRAAVASRVDEAMRKTALRDRRHQVIGSLSHGYRQRVGLAQAIVNQPKLLILDEPTGGLDPIQTQEMRSLIRELRGEHTVLLSSHLLSEISHICDRYLVISSGRLVAQGSQDDLARQLGGNAIIVDIEVAGDIAKAIAALKQVTGVRAVNPLEAEASGQAIRVDCDRDARADLVRSLVAANVDVLRIDRSTSLLENIFVQLTKGKEAS